MKREIISEAMGNISSRHIEEAAEFKADEKPSRSQTPWVKWASMAACFCLIITAAFIIATHINRGGNSGNNSGQSPDIVYMQYINGYLYEPISNPAHYYEKYPKLKDIAESTTTGYKYNLSEKDLGAYIGIAPAHDKAQWPEGKAYHWSAYPSLDSIIIVEREGKYSLYVFSGEVYPEDAQSSSSILAKYGLPEKVVSMDILNSESVITAKDIIAEICSMMEGKRHDTALRYRDRIWEAWLSEKGEGGVRYDGTDFSFDNAEIREEFAKFYGKNIKTIIINTENGFEITLRVDLRYNYFTMNSMTFHLSQAEAEQFGGLIK